MLCRESLLRCAFSSCWELSGTQSLPGHYRVPTTATWHGSSGWCASPRSSNFSMSLEFVSQAGFPGIRLITHRARLSHPRGRRALPHDRRQHLVLSRSRKTSSNRVGGQHADPGHIAAGSRERRDKSRTEHVVGEGIEGNRARGLPLPSLAAAPVPRPATPPRSVMNSRRFIRSPRRRGQAVSAAQRSSR
jgi:hypothetical protein